MRASAVATAWGEAVGRNHNPTSHAAAAAANGGPLMLIPRTAAPVSPMAEIVR
jgi:hypothetical protein